MRTGAMAMGVLALVLLGSLCGMLSGLVLGPFVTPGEQVAESWVSLPLPDGHRAVVFAPIDAPVLLVESSAGGFLALELPVVRYLNIEPEGLDWKQSDTRDPQRWASQSQGACERLPDYQPDPESPVPLDVGEVADVVGCWARPQHDWEITATYAIGQDGRLWQVETLSLGPYSAMTNDGSNATMLLTSAAVGAAAGAGLALLCVVGLTIIRRQRR